MIKLRMTKESLVFIMFVMMSLMFTLNLVVMAQAVPGPIGFHFRRVLGLMGLNSDSIQWHKSEVERLTMLLEAPEGDRWVRDTAGNPVNWTATRIADCQALVQGHYDRLADLGEGAWTYTYTPDVIIP